MSSRVPPAGSRPAGEQSAGPSPWPPVPDDVRAAARAAFARRDAQALVADEVASMPSSRRPGRLLRFATPDTRVDVHVRRTGGGGLVLLVCVHPRAAVTVRVRHGGPDLTKPSRPDGRCRLSPVRPGPVSLVVSGAGRRTATAWTCL